LFITQQKKGRIACVQQKFDRTFVGVRVAPSTVANHPTVTTTSHICPMFQPSYLKCWISHSLQNQKVF